MTTLLILAGACILALLLIGLSLLRLRTDATSTWICASCLQGFGRYEHALVHMAAVHPRPR